MFFVSSIYFCFLKWMRHINSRINDTSYYQSLILTAYIESAASIKNVKTCRRKYAQRSPAGSTGPMENIGALYKNKVLKLTSCRTKEAFAPTTARLFLTILRKTFMPSGSSI